LVPGELPRDFDTVADLFGRRAMSTRPALVAMVASYRVGDAEQIVDDAIVDCFLVIKAIFAREESTKLFAYLGPPQSIPSWILARIGNPLRPKQGGIIQTVIKRERAKLKREAPMDETSDVAIGEGDEFGDLSADLVHLLASLEPRERFVIECRYWFSPGNKFDTSGLRELCRRAGVKDTASIVRRSKGMNIPATAKTLTVREMAVLLDLSEKQVTRIHKEAVLKLRETHLALTKSVDG